MSERRSTVTLAATFFFPRFFLIVASALERSRPPAGALVASTAAWGLLLLGLATSRKPS